MVIQKELTKEKIYFTIFRACALFSVATLLFILAYIIINGISVINWQFLTSTWSHQDITQGGIVQAIIGSLMLAVGVTIIAVPIGVATAIYLNEYAKDTPWTRIIRLSIRNLAGVPSIIYGIFGLAFFVLLLNFGTSLVAASLTLGCMTLPWIITTTEEALKATPQSFREASLALGATKWETIRNIVLPTSLGGIITGSILGVGRAMGETAPIIMVGATFFISYIPVSPFDKFMALPYHLFILGTQHASPHARSYALGTALVLITMITLLNIGVFIIRYNVRRKKDW